MSGSEKGKTTQQQQNAVRKTVTGSLNALELASDRGVNLQ